MSVADDIFTRRRTISTYWRNKSDDLHAAAAAVWHSMDPDVSAKIVEHYELGVSFQMSAAVPGVFRMLCGMSLELLYKAILVSQARTVPHTHNLVELARSAGAAVSDRDAGLLEILSECIKWGGRYPVPKQAESFNEFSELVGRHLVDVEPGTGRFRGGRPNRALAWDGFERLRSQALPLYVHSHV